MNYTVANGSNTDFGLHSDVDSSIHSGSSSFDLIFIFIFQI